MSLEHINSKKVKIAIGDSVIEVTKEEADAIINSKTNQPKKLKETKETEEVEETKETKETEETKQAEEVEETKQAEEVEKVSKRKK